MSANENFKRSYREQLISDINDEDDESLWSWKHRTLQLFYAAVEIAESKLQEGELLSEQLIVESASLPSFEGYVGRSDKHSKVFKYLDGLPGFFLEGFYDAATQHHKFAEMALEELLYPDNSSRKKVFEANQKFAEKCRDKIKLMGIENHERQIWGHRALALIDASMEILGNSHKGDHVFTIADVKDSLQIPAMASYALVHPDSVASRYLDGLPGFAHGAEPGYETIREHQYTLIGLTRLLGASASA